ncbi:MAG: hypothetical protein LKI94_08250 [Sporolactobacillus sp.]|nr:hypothetical protein [Sporolactobacillus sp.]
MTGLFRLCAIFLFIIIKTKEKDSSAYGRRILFQSNNIYAIHAGTHALGNHLFPVI